jgi:hypothetical protein
VLVVLVVVVVFVVEDGFGVLLVLLVSLELNPAILVVSEDRLLLVLLGATEIADEM